MRVLNTLNSTVHKNALLRFIHGDIYSKERQFRFGLSDNPLCETCGEIETIDHKIIECDYANNLWQALARLTGETINQIDCNYVTGSYGEPSKALLTIHAEIIGLLIRNRRIPNVNPGEYIRKIILNLTKKEKGSIKTELENFIA